VLRQVITGRRFTKVLRHDTTAPFVNEDSVRWTSLKLMFFVNDPTKKKRECDKGYVFHSTERTPQSQQSHKTFLLENRQERGGPPSKTQITHEGSSTLQATEIPKVSLCSSTEPTKVKDRASEVLVGMRQAQPLWKQPGGF
jgi:hypothetical protein